MCMCVCMVVYLCASIGLCVYVRTCASTVVWTFPRVGVDRWVVMYSRQLVCCISGGVKTNGRS